MTPLVSIEMAKDHLRIDEFQNDKQEFDIIAKMEQASDMVVDRCNTTAHWRAITATWTEATVPKAVQAAILVVLTHLHEHRGDDMTGSAELWREVERRLERHKDPVVA